MREQTPEEQKLREENAELKSKLKQVNELTSPAKGNKYNRKTLHLPKKHK